MARIKRNSQNDEDQMSTNDPNGRENFIKRESFALGAPELEWRRVDSHWQKGGFCGPDICGCGDAIVFSRLRPGYSAPRKNPIHLWLSARKRCQK
jgi:hypothetical protein